MTRLTINSPSSVTISLSFHHYTIAINTALTETLYAICRFGFHALQSLLSPIRLWWSPLVMRLSHISSAFVSHTPSIDHQLSINWASIKEPSNNHLVNTNNHQKPSSTVILPSFHLNLTAISPSLCSMNTCPTTRAVEASFSLPTGWMCPTGSLWLQVGWWFMVGHEWLRMVDGKLGVLWEPKPYTF